jgi:hypothetical protein
MVIADFLDPLASELEHFGSERSDDGPITIEGVMPILSEKA